MECFLCNSLSEQPGFREKKEEIKTFSKEIWQLCQVYLEARKHFGHKYKSAILPETWDDEVVGYHSSCYKDFIVKKIFEME